MFLLSEESTLIGVSGVDRVIGSGVEFRTAVLLGRVLRR